MPPPVAKAGVSIPDQNQDTFLDRVVDDVVQYRQFDGSFNQNDPLIHDSFVLYQGKRYRAVQQTADTWKHSRNQKDSKVCLLDIVSGQNSCGPESLVLKREVKPVVPTLFFYSSENCPPCSPIYDDLRRFVSQGWCQSRLVKLDVDKISHDLQPGEGPPNIKHARTPFLALLQTNGIWRSLPQWGNDFKTTADYTRHIYGQLAQGEPGKTICEPVGDTPPTPKLRPWPPN